MQPNPSPFYYLTHFHQALDWLSLRENLLAPEDALWIAYFRRQPQDAQALLIRLTMRTPAHFRISKLDYPEIDVSAAVNNLTDLGWVSQDHLLTPSEAFHLLRKAELDTLYGAQPTKQAHWPDMAGQPDQTFHQWTQQHDCLTLTIRDQLDRLRLAFFGNLHQGWESFVLEELGITHFPKVSMDHSCGFEDQREFESCWQAHQLSEQWEIAKTQNKVPTALIEQAIALPAQGPSLRRLRSRLLASMARFAERQAQYSLALSLLSESRDDEARLRSIRCLEKATQTDQAWRLALQTRCFYQSDAERDGAFRMLPRLSKALGRSWPRIPRYQPNSVEVFTELHCRPEPAAAQWLDRDGGISLFSENRLFTTLFTLHFWDVIYAPIPGAFFHPFQAAPADVQHPDFVSKRSELWNTGFEQLKTEAGRQILWNYHRRFGTTAWGVDWRISAEQIELALHCISADHLSVIFQRILIGHRKGLPDLIRFFPDQRRFELVEVKGPGDALQPHQRQWLRYFDQHGIPNRVCWIRDLADAV